MSEVMEKESSELVTVPSKETALQTFVSDKGLDPYLQTIRQELDKFLESAPALDTAKGRKEYASMAHKIARSKTAIDSLGKELVAELKKQPAKVDAERKRWRDQLDAWRDEARGPLNKWEEAENARIARHQDHIEQIKGFEVCDELSAAGISVQIDNLKAVTVDEKYQEFEAEAHRAKEQAVKVLDAALDRQKKHEAEQAELERLRQEAAEREQKEREERIAREATERARREAEQAAQAERDAAAKREQLAKDEAERKEREAKEAAERREREHQAAIEKAQQEASRERQRIEAEHKRKEEERLAEEQRQQKEAGRRQADKEHRGSVNRAALEAMVKGGMPEDCAKQAVTLIAKGQIPSVTINY